MNYISPDIFRAYDIRGIVGETLTNDSVYWIARSIGHLAQEQNQDTLIIGRDGRLSGPLLSQSLQAGLLDAGCKVIDIGAVPTPLLYFAVNTLSTQSGVILTGSHNPANYNGLKIVIAGETLSENKIQKIYQNILEAKLEETPKKNLSKAYLEHYDHIVHDYIQYVQSLVQLNPSKSLKIVVDAGNGIAGKVAPNLYRALGVEVIELFCEVDGHFPHHHPDPSDPKNLKHLIEAVKHHHADAGLAFDGDGDRLGVITNLGEIIYPDRQLMLYAKDVLKRYPGEKIIFDVKCSVHLGKVIASFGGTPEMYKTGHSLIKKRLIETKAPLAGEMSGHIFFKDQWFGFDDALYTGIRLLKILSDSSQTLSEIFSEFPNSINTPELKLPIDPEQREKILTALPLSPAFKNTNRITIDGLRVEFENGWGLVRASNTTPTLTLRFEAKNLEALQQIQQLFREEIRKLVPTLELTF